MKQSKIREFNDRTQGENKNVGKETKMVKEERVKVPWQSEVRKGNILV